MDKKHLILIGGSGQWAKNYISTIAQFYPNIKLTIATRDNWQQLIKTGADAVIISTPPSVHIQMAQFTLDYKIPVLIEKPLALNYNDCLVLKQYNIPILINHIHLFSNAYQNIKSKIDKIDYIATLGFNNGPKRDYSSLYDYGCHDIAMIIDLANYMPITVSAQEIKTDTGYLFKIIMKFKDFISESLVGNGGKKSVRKLRVETDGIRISYNDKLKHINHKTPLYNVLDVFFKSIDGKSDYRLGIDLPLNVIKILECCEKSLANNNIPVFV